MSPIRLSCCVIVVAALISELALSLRMPPKRLERAESYKRNDEVDVDEQWTVQSSKLNDKSDVIEKMLVAMGIVEAGDSLGAWLDLMDAANKKVSTVSIAKDTADGKPTPRDDEIRMARQARGYLQGLLALSKQGIAKANSRKVKKLANNVKKLLVDLRAESQDIIMSDT